MEKILIDKFIVPETSKASFLESAHKVQRFLKTLPASLKDFSMRRKKGKADTTI